jgi:hypothetical protein
MGNNDDNPGRQPGLTPKQGAGGGILPSDGSGWEPPQPGSPPDARPGVFNGDKRGPSGGVLPKDGRSWTPPQPGFDPSQRKGVQLPTDYTTRPIEKQAPWPMPRRRPDAEDPISPEYPDIPSHGSDDEEGDDE